MTLSLRESLQRLPLTRDPSHFIIDGQTWLWWTSIKGKPLTLFFKLRPDFEQFYQKEIVKVFKQPISKSITVLKRRLVQYDKRLALRAAAAL